jgi:predicted metalloprotease
MKWQGRNESDNVEDRRGMSKGKLAIGGGAVGIVIIIIKLFLGGDPQQVIGEALQQTSSSNTGAASPEEDAMAKFVSVVLADNEDVWNKVFQEEGLTYEEPKLVLFRSQVESACGNASASTGPFYCPADKKVYIDLSFFDELKNKLGAPGDFAMAYVIAHEVGHHVQNLLGTSSKVHQLEQRSSEKEANKLSVALELQADFLAGVWANKVEKMNMQSGGVIEEGDIEEAMGAASAVGDDRLQKQAQGYVVPDAFTHGTSAQRMSWFKRGLQSGNLNDGDTFKELLGQ